MVSLNWNISLTKYWRFSLLQASTLEALARIQALESKTREAAQSRAVLYDKLEAEMNQNFSETNVNDLEGILSQLPRSERQQKLLHRVQETSKRWQTDNVWY